MRKGVDSVPIPIVTSIISAISIIIGSLVGAYCSWIINKNMHNKEIEDQQKILKRVLMIYEMKG